MGTPLVSALVTLVSVLPGSKTTGCGLSKLNAKEFLCLGVFIYWCKEGQAREEKMEDVVPLPFQCFRITFPVCGEVK